MDAKTLKASVRSAFEAMEESAAALEPVEGVELTEDEVAERNLAFDKAEKSHEKAVEQLERAEKMEVAKRNLPVEVVEDDKPEVVEARESVKVGKEELVYRSDFAGASFFKDVRDATKGDTAARERLAHSAKQVAEERAGINSTDTSGGEFVPPVWLLDQYIAVARASRPTANAVNRLPLPPGTDSINIPAVTGGTTTAAQQDAGTVSNTDPVTATVTAPVITIAGDANISRQAFERSAGAGTGLEQVIGADLAADYAKQIDVQVLRGSGSSGDATGIYNVSGITTVSYTTASPVVTGSATAADNLYPKIANAIQKVHTLRYLAPTAIIMHPRRFASIITATDTQGRPLVTPIAQAVNTVGVLERVGAENVVGQIQGVPVIVDSNIATNLTVGSGSNEDVIYVTRLEDQWLWEDTPKIRVFEEVLAATGQIKIQLFGYAAFTGARYPKATTIITGTGMTTPTF